MLSLDVGCGENKKGTIGVDCRRLENVDIVCDIHFLPFSNEVFDEVRNSVVIEHSLNPFNFLLEQTRVLKKNGRLVCEADNASYWRYSIDFSPFEQYFPKHFKGKTYSASEEHNMIFYPESICRLLKRAGLTETGFVYHKPSKKLDKILQLLFPFFHKNLSSRFTVVGKK